jgi:hypothetical protein
MDNDSSSYSEFAAILRRLLDDTGVFGRREWSEFLGVSQAAISQWLSDRTIPRPETLGMIVDLVKSSDRAPSQLLSEFGAMVSRPASEVSPNGARFGESLAAYLIGPLMDNLLLDLKGLGTALQEKVILKASLLCAAERGFGDNQTQSLGSFQTRPFMKLSTSKQDFSPVERGSEASLAVVERRIPGFLEKIMRHLTDHQDESAQTMVRSFCGQALSLVRAQKNTRPLMLISQIIKSGELDHTRLERIWSSDALNMLFLADENIAVLLRQGSGYAVVRLTADTELDEVVQALSGRDVMYVPEANLMQCYRRVSLQEVRNAA